jgi:hypothetical protein
MTDPTPSVSAALAAHDAAASTVPGTFRHAEWQVIRAHIADLQRELDAARRDAARLDYIERTFSGMTNRERYLPVQMIWGKGAMGRTLREACDKYMKREQETPNG